MESWRQQTFVFSLPFTPSHSLKINLNVNVDFNQIINPTKTKNENKWSVISGQWSSQYLQLATDVNKCICLELLELPELLELLKNNY